FAIDPSRFPHKAKPDGPAVSRLIPAEALKFTKVIGLPHLVVVTTFRTFEVEIYLVFIVLNSRFPISAYGTLGPRYRRSCKEPDERDSNQETQCSFDIF